jgi:hypothetical protein
MILIGKYPFLLALAKCLQNITPLVPCKAFEPAKLLNLVCIHVCQCQSTDVTENI